MGKIKKKSKQTNKNDHMRKMLRDINNNENENKALSLQDKIENCKYGYDLVNYWISNADNKVSISCALFTGVFGIINFLSGRIATKDSFNELFRFIFWLCFSLGLLCMGISIFFYVLAINPNLGSSVVKKECEKLEKKYLLFYGDISKMTIDQFKEKINNATGIDIINELLSETHYNSDICNKKMVNYKVGLWFSFFAVVASLVGWASRFLMYNFDWIIR